MILDDLKKNITPLYVFRFVIYPITNLIVTPTRFLISFIAFCKSLTNYSEYSRFSSHLGINSVFYWTQAFNLKKYGRSGVSPHLGLGDYKLSKWFYISIPSHYLFWKYSFFVPFFMFLWLISFFVWFGDLSILSFSIVIILTIFSTTYYSAIVILQNYNSFGWAFLPIFIFALQTQNLTLIIISLFFICVGSFTVAFFSFAMLFLLFVFDDMEWPILGCTIPSIILIFLQLIPSLKEKNTLANFMHILKAIGFSNKTKLVYERKSELIYNLANLYYTIIYFQFSFFFYLANGITSNTVLLWFCVLAQIINSFAFRIADRQSLYLLNTTLIVSSIIVSFNYLLLIPFWIAISPLPFLIGLTKSVKNPFSFPNYKPFKISLQLKEMEKFLSLVKSKEKILFCFDNPNGDYNKVFDNYRVIYELPLYAASNRGIHLFPDWWTVFESNYEGALGFWGRDLISIKRNIKAFKPDFIIIYQTIDKELDKIWIENNFSIISSFDWGNAETLLKKPYLPWLGDSPKWWLLKVPKQILID